MKKLFLLLILSFFSAQGFAESCPDGNEPKKTVSLDGTYFEYKCDDNSSEINTFGGGWPPEKAILNNETLRYMLYRYIYQYPKIGYRHHEVKVSTNPYNFEFDLREDEYIKQHMQETPLLSYLMYEDGKIVVDEITPKDRFGDMFTNSSLYTSMSMGKSIASYITGHAICEGKIKSVDSRLNDWPILEDTLYHNQKLIDLLNMAAGDSAYVNNNGFISTTRNSKNLNSPSIRSIMENELKGSKKSFAQYNYVNSIPNYVLTYVLFKYGDDDFKRLLDDIFMKKVRIRDEIWINKNEQAGRFEQSLFHTVYVTRYDYLRIAKAMLDDWQNDTCVGQYLKTIHERRIPKNGAQGTTGRVGLPLSYGGFFHTGYKGMENRPVMSMDGWGGQTIMIDFERGRIIATLSAHDRMRFPQTGSLNWKKIVYERIKNGKPDSISTKEAKQSNEPVINPQQLIFENKVRRETDRKAEAYWANYFNKILKGKSSFGSSTNNENLENPYADETTTVETTKVETTKVEISDSDPAISKVIEVINGDKFIFNIAKPHEFAGFNINVNLKDIDAPDATKSCPEQMELGIEVRDYVAQKLENASSIKLTNLRKTNTKIIAQVIVDGIDLGDELVLKGYASKEYGYWKPYFCSPSTAYGLGNQYLNIDGNSAIFWYERAMLLDPDSPTKTIATFNLHTLYKGIDEVKSIVSLRKSAVLEYIPAMEKLGAAYLYGDGVEKDSNQAKKWLNKAFDKGSRVAEGIYCGSLEKAKQKTCKF